MRLPRRAVVIYITAILVLVAAGFLYQTTGVGGVIALAVVLAAGVALVARRRHSDTP